MQSDSNPKRNSARLDKPALTQDLLERKLLAGLHAGPAREMTSKDWINIRREVRRRAAETSNRKRR